jgi:hypothetical protein
LSYVAAIAVVLGACAAALANFDIPWRTIDGGGGTSAGGAFALSGTIGQPDPGPVMSGGAFTLTGGFWAIPAGPPDCPGDLDGDLDVDQADLGILLAAYNQNGDGDLDGDGDTDQADLGILLGNYGADC